MAAVLVTSVFSAESAAGIVDCAVVPVLLPVVLMLAMVLEATLTVPQVEASPVLVEASHPTVPLIVPPIALSTGLNCETLTTSCAAVPRATLINAP